MIRTILISTLILGSALSAAAETYKWTDDRGVINFSDDISSVPRRYRKKVKTMEDITIRNPEIQKEQEEKTTPPLVATPDSGPSPAPTTSQPPAPLPQIKQQATSSDELPPGRTKSQRIQDNIERRQAEEKAKRGGAEPR